MKVLAMKISNQTFVTDVSTLTALIAGATSHRDPAYPSRHMQ